MDLMIRGFPGGASGKELTCQCRKQERRGFDPWVRKISWRKHGNPLQYSCLGNPMDRGAWWDTVHKVAKSRTWLKRPSMHWWLAGAFPTFIGHLSHTDTCVLSAVKDSSLWSCAWSAARLLGSSGLSPLRSNVSTIKKQLQLFRPACVLAKDLQNGRNEYQLTAWFLPPAEKSGLHHICLPPETIW